MAYSVHSHIHSRGIHVTARERFIIKLKGHIWEEEDNPYNSLPKKLMTKIAVHVEA